jgi:hypothetical protein
MRQLASKLRRQKLRSAAPIRRQEMTMLDGGPPEAKQQDRALIDEFRYQKLPDIKTLEELRNLQTEEREYLDLSSAMVVRGASSSFCGVE